MRGVCPPSAHEHGHVEVWRVGKQTEIKGSTLTYGAMLEFPDSYIVAYGLVPPLRTLQHVVRPFTVTKHRGLDEVEIRLSW